MLRYPVVDVRLLALDELFRLLRERETLIDLVLGTWADLEDGQKEYVAVLLFSLGIASPARVSVWAPQLLELVRRERHYNLRATAAEAIYAAELFGANLHAGVLAAAGE
ncbi:MAG: hypothetical protein EHM18_03055 [Acidobacteria bacterium]|nr:MAG: hypothetical protein EHM18_03055 [Acidobacteriota bacterium]